MRVAASETALWTSGIIARMSTATADWRDTLNLLLAQTSKAAKNQPLALQIEGELLVPLRPDPQGNFSTKRASWRDLNSHWASVTQGLNSAQLATLRSFYEVAQSAGQCNWTLLTEPGRQAVEAARQAGVRIFSDSAREHIWVPANSWTYRIEFSETHPVKGADSVAPDDSSNCTRLRIRRFHPQALPSTTAPLAGDILVDYQPSTVEQILAGLYAQDWSVQLDPAEHLEFWGNWAARLDEMNLLVPDPQHLVQDRGTAPVFSPAQLRGILQPVPGQSQQLQIQWSVVRTTASGQVLELPLDSCSFDAEVMTLMEAVTSLRHLHPDQAHRFFNQVFPIWELPSIRRFIAQINASGRARISEDPQLENIEIFEQGPELSYELSAKGPRGFDLRLALLAGDEELELGSFWQALRRGERWWATPEGNWVDLYVPQLTELRDIIAQLRDLGLSEFSQGFSGLGLTHLGLIEALDKVAHQRKLSADWESAVKVLANPPAVPTPRLPASSKATWRPYQEQGFRWLHARAEAGLGGVLADEMGLGKTLQMLALVDSWRGRGPVFAVVPASLLGTWQEQAHHWFPQLRLAVFSSSVGGLESDLARARDRVSQADLVLTTYTLQRMDGDFWSQIAFAGLILDEAQSVKNPETATHKSLCQLQCGWCFALSGTPLENRPTDLWSILAISVPGLLPSRRVFERSLAQATSATSRQVSRQHLGQQVAPFLLRRTKSQVVNELPEKIEQLIYLELQPQQASLYSRYLQVARAETRANWGQTGGGNLDTGTNTATAASTRLNVLTALTRLRQLTLSGRLLQPELAEAGTKVDYLLQALPELAAQGHQALVFSQFTSFLAILCEGLDRARIPYAYLDGSTKDRDAQVKAFQDHKVPVFLISLKAGGFGLNLTQADYVFLCDPWWNPAVENQAVDRAHRLGQNRRVNVYRLVATGTIEEHVLALQERKRELIDQVLQGTHSPDSSWNSNGAISLAELRALLER